jgi:hypothetical protein
VTAVVAAPVSNAACALRARIVPRPLNNNPSSHSPRCTAALVLMTARAAHSEGLQPAAAASHDPPTAHAKGTHGWASPICPAPALTKPTPLTCSITKAASSGRDYPEPLRAPLPIGSMHGAAAVHTTMSPPPKGFPPAAKLGVVVSASALAPPTAQPATLLPNKMRGKEGHLANVAALAGLHASDAEPVSETFKTMVR